MSEKAMKKPIPAVFTVTKRHLTRALAGYEATDREFEVHSWDCAVCSGDESVWCKSGTELLDAKDETGRLYHAFMATWERQRKDAGAKAAPGTATYRKGSHGSAWERADYAWSEPWVMPFYDFRPYGFRIDSIERVTPKPTAASASPSLPRAAGPSSDTATPRPTRRRTPRRSLRK